MIKGKHRKWILTFLAVLAFGFTGLALQQSQEKQEQKAPENDFYAAVERHAGQGPHAR